MSKPNTKTQQECKNCGRIFLGAKNKVFCGSTCQRKWQRSANKCHTIGLCTGTVGAISEIIVATDLMKRGYDVYRALSHNADSDIVAIKGNAILKIEVRTGQYYTAANGAVKLIYTNERIAGKMVVVVTHIDNKIHYIGDFGFC